jgi:hypothetical protein
MNILVRARVFILEMTLKSVLEGPFEPERFPTQFIRPERGRLVWLVDRAPAGHLYLSEGERNY